MWGKVYQFEKLDKYDEVSEKKIQEQLKTMAENIEIREKECGEQLKSLSAKYESTEKKISEPLSRMQNIMEMMESNLSATNHQAWELAAKKCNLLRLVRRLRWNGIFTFFILVEILEKFFCVM